MPRMRDAIRSGWNHSSWSSFSPTEASLIGLPVTAFTESAAPPRASPSSFVITTPSKSTRSWNACATLTASWPVIASSTSSTFVGFASRRIAASSSISGSSIWRRPAVSRITTSRSSAVRALDPVADRLHRVAALVGVDGNADLRAELDRAGRSRQGAGGRRRRARAACRPSGAGARACRRRSSCPSPGDRRAGSSSAAAARTRASSEPEPISAVSSSWTIFTTCWPGRQALLDVLRRAHARERGRRTA